MLVPFADISNADSKTVINNDELKEVLTSGSSSDWEKNYRYSKGRGGLLPNVYPCWTERFREDGFLARFVKFEGSSTTTGMTTCEEGRVVLLRGTVLYTMGDTSVQDLSGTVALKYLEKSYDIFHYLFADNTVTPLPKLDQKADNTIRAYNILGNKFPKALHSNYGPTRGDYKFYDISKKKSWMIMALYKAMGVEYTTKPLIVSTPLEPGDNRTELVVLDTPYYKDLTHSINERKTLINNGMGRTIIFSDTNYLEAYMRRAMNDNLIKTIDILPSKLEHISGAQLDHSMNGFYFLDMNPPHLMASQKNTSIKPDEITDFYLTSRAGIQINPALQIMSGEDSGYTYLDFATLAYKIMHLSGEPVMVDAEQEELLIRYGAVIPEGLTKDQRDAIVYLVSRGVVSPDLKATELNKRITDDQVYEIIMRIADKGSRLTFKVLTSALDKDMAKNGYYPINQLVMDPKTVPEKQETILYKSSFTHFDYFIRVDDITTFRDSKSGEKLNDLVIKSEKTNQVVGDRMPDIKLGPKDTMFYHFKVPMNVTENLYITSSQGNIYPEKIGVTYGGGVYTNATDSNQNGTVTTELISEAELVEIEKDIPYSAMWGRKYLKLPEKWVIPSDGIYRFAAQGATFDYKFATSNIKNLKFMNKSLLELYNLYKVTGAPVSVEDASLVFKEITEGNSKLIEVTATLSNKYIDYPEKLLSVKDEDKIGYPAYVSKSGSTMITTKYLQNELGLMSYDLDDDYLIISDSRGKEVVIYKNKNFVVSGSQIIDFKDNLVYKKNGEDGALVDYRAVVPFIQKEISFKGDGENLVVSGADRKISTAKVHLWTDYNAASYSEVSEDGNSINLATLNAVTSPLVIMRDIDDLENPKVTVVRSSGGKESDKSANIKSFFKSSLPAGVVGTDIAASEFKVDENGIWYTPVDKNSYSQESTPIPIYKTNKTLMEKPVYEVDNVPLVVDDEDEILKDTVVDATNISYINQLSTLPGDPFKGGSKDANVTAGKSKVSAQPVIINALGGYSATSSLGDLNKNSLIFMGGGIYRIVDTSIQDDKTVTLVKYATSDALEHKRIPFLRAIGYKDIKVEDGNRRIQVPKTLRVTILASYYDDYVEEGQGSRPRTLYISNLETLNIDTSSLKSADESNIFNKLSKALKSLFGDADLEEANKRSQMFTLDNIMMTLYILVMEVLPRILLMSLLSVSAISLTRENKVMKKAMKKFDIVYPMSLFTTRFENLRGASTWIYGILGSAMIVMIHRLLIFKIIDKIFELF